MSTQRLSKDEMATYLIGAAFRRLLDEPEETRDEQALAMALRFYVEVVLKQLNQEEADEVMSHTGLVHPDYLKEIEGEVVNGIEGEHELF